jgi:hypothetical protein
MIGAVRLILGFALLHCFLKELLEDGAGALILQGLGAAVQGLFGRAVGVESAIETARWRSMRGDP